MPEMTPDFRNRTPAIDPTAFATVLQRKAQIDEQRREFEQNQKDARIKGLIDAVVTGQQIASNMMTLAEKRTQQKSIADIQRITQEPTTPPTLIGPSITPEETKTQLQEYQTNRQNRLESAFAGAEPKEYVAAKMKQYLNGNKSTLDLQAKSILHDDKPMEALFDKTSGNFYDPVSKQILTGKIEPYSPTNAPVEVTDQDRKRLAGLVKQVKEGKATPQMITNVRSNDKEKLSMIAAEEGIDLTTIDQRRQIRKDYTQHGNAGKSLTAFNTAIAHSETLNNKVAALNNADFKIWNKIANKVGAEAGKPELAGFRAVRNIFADEMAKAAQGGSGIITESERQRQLDAFDSASSKEQMKEVIHSTVQLMASKSKVLKDNWESTMAGVEPATPFVTSTSKSVLKKHGINPDTLEQEETPSFNIDQSALDAELKKRGLQ